VSDFERWWWFDKSDIRWRACVVTMRRLNRYEIIQIRRLSSIENFVREMILYSIRLETLSQWRDCRIGVMCWNFGAWTTVRAREFLMCWPASWRSLGADRLSLRGPKVNSRIWIRAVDNSTINIILWSFNYHFWMISNFRLFNHPWNLTSQ